MLTCFITVSLNTKHVASIGVIWLLEYQPAGRGETERSQAFENIIQHFPKADSFQVVFHQRGGGGWRVGVLVGSAHAFTARKKYSFTSTALLPDGNHLVRTQAGGRGRVFKFTELHIQLHFKKAVR